MQDDRSYFYDRAETELELAQRATHPLAVRAHYIIANHYLDRCYGGGGGGEGAGDGEAGQEDAGTSPPASRPPAANDPPEQAGRGGGDRDER